MKQDDLVSKCLFHLFDPDDTNKNDDNDDSIRLLLLEACQRDEQDQKELHCD